MLEAEQNRAGYLTQKQRLGALAAHVLLLVVISKVVTGDWFPVEAGKRLWLLSGLGLWFFVLISAPWFRPPRDSFVNAFAAGLLLALVDMEGVSFLGPELNLFRWVAVGLAGLITIAATLAMTFRETDPLERPREAILSRISYRVSDSLGRAKCFGYCFYGFS